MKKFTQYFLAILLTVGVIGTGTLSVFTLKSVKAMSQDVNEYINNDKDVAREDDVTIADEYHIKSTLPISDAYKSGDKGALDDKQKETLKMASDVLKNIIKKEMTPYEKEIAVYKWMTSKLKNDESLLLVIPTTSKDSDNPYGVLKYHNAVCVGYATTFRLFMQMMNIKCMVVHNTTMFHSWDLVQLDGEWYHTDIYSDQEEGNFEHFNMNDTQCANGNEWNTEFFPAANGTKYSYSYNHIKTLKDIYGIAAEVKTAVKKKQNCIFLDFKQKMDEDTANVAENILKNITDYFSSSDNYASVSAEWNWSNADGRYYLCIYLSGLNNNAKKLPKETLNKISKNIGSVFGISDYTASDYSANEQAEDTL